MIQRSYGTLNSRNLDILLFSPMVMSRYNGEGFSLWWPNLLNPYRWYQAGRSREKWSLFCKRFVGCNHRCYCDGGTSIDGRIMIFGFGVSWWYSHYTGAVPCPCDEAVKKFFRCD